MDTEKMATLLQEAWPGLHSGLDCVLKNEWGSLATRIEATETEGVPDGEAHPLNEFTVPLANLAHVAGFQNNGQGEDFIEAAIEAAGVPDKLRSLVQITFAVHLHARGDQ